MSGRHRTPSRRAPLDVVVSTCLSAAALAAGLALAIAMLVGVLL